MDKLSKETIAKIAINKGFLELLEDMKKHTSCIDCLRLLDILISITKHRIEEAREQKEESND